MGEEKDGFNFLHCTGYDRLAITFPLAIKKVKFVKWKDTTQKFLSDLNIHNGIIEEIT
jgi:hypothetical protein